MMYTLYSQTAFTEDVYQGPKRSLCTEACTSTDSLPHRQKRNLENGITEKLLLTKQCPSTYDTAWVSMVPAQGSPQTPRFPQFVQWIQQNQNDDGSWGLGNLDLSLLGKDAITSTTACILSLKRWSIGNEQIMKGISILVTQMYYICIHLGLRIYSQRHPLMIELA